MRKIMLMLILASEVVFAYAQKEFKENDDEIQTIFSRNHKNGWYVSFTTGYGQIDSKDALISGGRFMFVFDRKLGVGFGGYGFINDLDQHHYMNGGPSENSLGGGYGGLVIEPVRASRLPLHLSFPVLIGAGGIAKNTSDWWDNTTFDDGTNDTYFVFEPAAELELNFTRFFRISGMISYRFTSEIDLDQVDRNATKGLNFGLTFKLGKF